MIKRIINNPYLYIFISSYIGVWLLWDRLRLPGAAPSGVVSALAQQGYSPSDNLLRFLAAIFVPAASCFVYWLLWHDKKISNMVFGKPSKIIKATVVLVCVLLALAMGVVQNSTNPAHNQPDQYGGPYSYAMLDTFHEGETLGSAVSYQNPSMKPYRDFIIVHGVFQDPLRSVIAFDLFGRSIGSVRTFTTILVMITVLAYYVLLLILFRGSVIKSSIGLVALAVLMLPENVMPIISTHFVGVQLPFRDMATILFLGLAVASLRFNHKMRARYVNLVGGLIGFIVFAGFANSIDRALYILALSVVWLVLLFVVAGKKVVKKMMPYFILGSAAGIVILGLALKWAYSDFISYLFTIMRDKEYLDGIVFVQPNMARSALLLITGISIATAGYMILRGLPKKATNDLLSKNGLRAVMHQIKTFASLYPVEILLFVTGLFFLRSAIGRADVGHFAYSVQWLYLFVLYVVLEHTNLSRRSPLAFKYVGLIMLFVIFSWYSAAVKSIDISRDTFPLGVKDSSFVRKDYTETAAFLRQNLHGSETFLTLTSEGSWYYLVNKPSPSRYFVAWYAFLQPQRNELANTIKQDADIKYIITNNNWTSNFDYIPNPERFPRAYRELQLHYRPIKGIGQQTIWERN